MKKRRGKSSSESSSGIHNSVSSEHMETENSTLASEDVDLLNCTVVQANMEEKPRRKRGGSENADREDDREEALLRLPEMKDSSMDTVGQPLCDVMERLNGALDEEAAWGPAEEAGEKSNGAFNGAAPPAQQPFPEDSQSEPPDRLSGEKTGSPVSPRPDFLQAPSPGGTDVLCFAPFSPDTASSGGGCNDSSEQGQSQALSGGLKAQGEAEAAAAGRQSDVTGCEHETLGHMSTDEGKDKEEDKLSPSEGSHPAEFM